MHLPRLDPTEITSILKQKIQEFHTPESAQEVGFVLTVGDGTALVWGMTNVCAGEMVIFDSGLKGMVMNLWSDHIGIVLLGDDRLIKQGDVVRRSGHRMEVAAGPGLLGRVVDALGNPIDGRGPLTDVTMTPIERPAPVLWIDNLFMSRCKQGSKPSTL